MVELKHITEYDYIDLFLKNKYIGRVSTTLAFLDIRLQIREQKLEGYQIKINGRKEFYKIDSDGKVHCSAKDLLGRAYTEYMSKLF